MRPLLAKQLERQVNDCRTLLLSITPADAKLLMAKHRLPANEKREIILGSAAPVSADGWFLTANHVVTDAKSHELLVIYNVAGARKYGRARVMWQDAKADLALLKSSLSTPTFYRFTPRDQDLPEGTQIFHAGITTGNNAQIGELSQRVSGRGSAAFLHTLRLAPGDSGGPVLLFSGELVGVNTAVGYVSALDTTFFNASTSSRPDPAVVQAVVKRAPRPQCWPPHDP
ncbi:MAG: protease Do [Verrucomicrobiaceae bacterium]|nr:protease Do [Verrucomicrobiaceae bacterium]